MPSKPSTIVDILVSAWIVFIAVMYYGGYFNELSTLSTSASTGIAIGPLSQFTGTASSIYGVVLILAVAAAARRYLAAKPESAKSP